MHLPYPLVMSKNGNELDGMRIKGVKATIFPRRARPGSGRHNFGES